MMLDAFLRLLASTARRDQFDVDGVVAGLTEDRFPKLVSTLEHALTNDELHNERYRLVTSVDVPEDFPKALGDLLTQLEERGLLGDDIVANHNLDTADSLRLWAYADPWVLSEQDEDLMLMTPQNYRKFLLLSTESECPKAGYMRSLVEHDIRDSAHAYIGTPRYTEYVTGLHEYVDLARSTDAHSIADYIERLIHYVDQTKWDQQTMRQFGSDLTRCTAPPESDVAVTQVAGGWLVTTGGPVASMKQLYIDQHRGTVADKTKR